MSAIYHNLVVDSTQMRDIADLIHLSKLVAKVQICEISIQIQDLQLLDKNDTLNQYNEYESRLISKTQNIGQFFICNNVANIFLRNDNLINERNINFYAGFPLTNANGKNYGILNLMDVKSKKLTEHQISILLLITQKISKGLSRTVENLDDSINNCYNLEPEGVAIIFDSHGIIKYLNSELENILNTLVDKYGERSVFSIIHFEDELVLNEALAKMKRGCEFDNFSIRLKNPTSNSISISLHATFDTFRAAYIAKGIFLKNRFEHTSDLIKENDRLKDFFGQINELICTHSLDGNLLSVNKAFAENLGFNIDQLLKLSLFDIVPESNHDKLHAYLHEIRSKGFANGKMFVKDIHENIKTWKYKNIFIEELHNYPSFIAGSALDITEQYLLEKDLKFTQQILEQTNQVARVGGWEVDIENQKVYWTSMTKIIHEVEIDYVPNIANGINFYKSGESREKIIESITCAMETGRAFDHELQLITAKGKEIWVRALGTSEFEDGKCKRLYGTFQDIDTQKKSSIALIEAKKLLDNVLKSASEISIIATDLHGTITLFNSGAESMLGYDSSEMVGKQTVELIHDLKEIRNREIEISSEIGRNIEGFEVFTAMTEFYNAEKRDWTYIKKDKSKLTVSLVVTPVKDGANETVGYLGIAHDITHSKAMEKALEIERSRLTAFVKHTPAAVAMLDNNMKYVAVSNQWIEDYRIGLRRIEGLSHYDIFPNLNSDSRERHKNVLNGHIEKKDEDIYIIPGSTEKKYISWEMRPWFNDNTIEGLMIFTRDVTEMVLYREQLKEAKQLAESANIAKSEFLANMSHEIRTPLNGVIGFTDLILKTKLNDLQHQYLSIASQSANSLLNIINDILDFSKIEAGKLELDNEKFDIHVIAAQSVEIIDYQIKTKGLEMLLNIPSDFPRFLWGDSVRLKQVLVNLLGNAVKFTTKGELELKLELISLVGDLAEIRFSVRDTGIGIPEDKKSQIFEAFSQADNSTTRKYGGTGLGLNISNKLLRMMDSKLSLLSTEGEGSIFFFEVKLRFEHGTLIEWENIDKVNNVLIVDDNANNRTIIDQMLTSQGINTIQVPTGEAALEVLNQEQKFDVVLMDYQMPGLNGIETSNQIRSVMMIGEDELPIILLHSSSEDRLIRKACEKFAIRQRLAKPLKIGQVLSSLSRLKVKDKKENFSMDLLDTITNNGKHDILVVEDDDFNMFLITTILRDLMPSSTIREAKNGLEGYKQTQNKMPSIIFMDIRMPVLDGYQATKKIRLLKTGRKVPIIAATAGNAKNEEDDCIACGMNDYLTKPYKEEQIIDILKKWLNLEFD